MKILHVITSLRTGGAEKLMVDLLPRLRDAEHEVALCLFDGIRTPFYDEIVAKGIKVYDFGAGNSVYSLRNIFRLRRLMKSFDIVHTHNTSPQFFAALANIGIGKRLVTTEHNTHNRRREWPGFAMVDRRMYSSYDTVICISDQAETNLRKFLGKSKVNITTIYNGVDVSHFANALPSAELERIAPVSKKLIMVAAFRPQKDQKTLIEAMRQLPEDF
ncbi:MAG: glycosyltransferase, partial [Muribaculaceae bacterium]|nr:glycosyltransferase [Muribaculaceae bacterium]